MVSEVLIREEWLLIIPLVALIVVLLLRPFYLLSKFGKQPAVRKPVRIKPVAKAPTYRYPAEEKSISMGESPATNVR